MCKIRSYGFISKRETKFSVWIQKINLMFKIGTLMAARFRFSTLSTVIQDLLWMI